MSHMLPISTAYCGIDVAFAKRKTLPVAVCIDQESGLKPLPLRDNALPKPPRGSGNRATLDRGIVACFASDVVRYLREIERWFAVNIATVAIDAPRDYADENQRRACERSMDAAGLSCFATPSRLRFAEIRARAVDHLQRGGAEARLPQANQLRMLVGFELFAHLEKEFDCIEVFPNAIIKTLDKTVGHKTTPDGLARQMQLLTQGSGILPTDIPSACYGSRHDQVDALLGAWVAATDKSLRVGFGDGERDTIWTIRPERAAIGA